MFRIAGGTLHRVRDTTKRVFAASQGNVENVDGAGTIGRGTGNEGVGEHVRTRFHFGSRSPVKLRT
jgi:hypothetical protein